MKAPRRLFDAHFRIGPYGTQSFAERAITPIPATRDHADGNDCAAYVERHGLLGGAIVPTYLEDQRAAFDAFMREYGRRATYQLVHMGEAMPIFAFVPRFIAWIEAGYDV